MTSALILNNETKLPSSFESPEAAALSIVDYFARPEEIMEEQVLFNRDGGQEIRQVPRVRPMPMVEEWCAMNRMTKRQLDEAAKYHPAVAEALEFARDVMKTYLVRKGLTEQYNPAFAKFVATNETDMVDKSEQTNRNLNANAADILDAIEKATKPIRRQ